MSNINEKYAPSNPDLPSSTRDSEKTDEDKTREELIGELEYYREEIIKAREYMNYLENLESIDRILSRSTDLEQMLKETLETVIWVFDCDRASLLFPSDPEAKSWRVPMECTRPEFPGAMALGVDIPMDAQSEEVFRLVRDAMEPVIFGPLNRYPVPDIAANMFKVKSQMAVNIYPWLGKPWLFIIHQCSAPRTWTSQEIRLFSEIANRLSAGLSSLLFSRNLKESENKLKTIFRAAANVSFVLFDATVNDGLITEFSPGAENIFGCKRDDIIGQPVSKLHPPDYIDHIITTREKMVREKKSFSAQKTMYRQSGQQFPAAVTLYPVFAESGQLTSIVEVVLEIPPHPLPQPER